MTNAPLSKQHWDNVYKFGDDRWSLDNPTPELVRLIRSGELIPKGKMCVIGSGKGFDAVFAAEMGFSVTAIDFSDQANNSARDLAELRGVSIEIAQCDLLDIPERYSGQFDFVFEYVTFCAFRPEYLPKLIENSFALLKTGGKLISVLFPIDGRSGGPPFAVDENRFRKLVEQSFEIIRMEQVIESVKPRKGNEALYIMEKK